jgi:hypothetical protein
MDFDDSLCRRCDRYYSQGLVNHRWRKRVNVTDLAPMSRVEREQLQWGDAELPAILFEDV